MKAANPTTTAKLDAATIRVEVISKSLWIASPDALTSRTAGFP